MTENSCLISWCQTELDLQTLSTQCVEWDPFLSGEQATEVKLT